MLALLAQADGGVSALDAAAVAEPFEPATLTQVIGPYMGVFFTAFFVAIIATPLMRMLAVRNGIVDLPDLKRKNHIEPVAYLGGVAIFLAWLTAIGLAYHVVSDGQSHFSPLRLTRSSPLVSIVIGAGAITLTGFFDDVFGISPRVKIGGQLFAAAALANYNVGTQLIGLVFSIVGVDTLHMFGWDALPLVNYILGTALIAAMVLGGCNAMNLIDGLDGLASGVTVIAGIGFLCIAGFVALNSPDIMKDPVRIVVCLALIGAVLGFLPYNFNPASIFMGDAGSLLLGYLCVASILLYADAGGRSLLLVTAGLIVFAVPITDTSLAIFRRKMQGKPILSPDSQHIHHLLRRSGLSVKQSVGVIYLAAGLFAALGYSMVAMELRWRYVLAVFFIIYGFIVVTAYKYGRQYALLHPADGAKTDEQVLPEAINGEDAQTDEAAANPANPSNHAQPDTPIRSDQP
jgi:UDP-GlcNAc:undecaprenyl-phosphate/decaprenyl-phosphate GlcNAc-1-phosphate transferase